MRVEVGVTLTCWTTAAFPHSGALNGSLIRTSKAPWRAQLLAPASLLNLTRHHHWGRLDVYPLRTSARQTWCCCRWRYASFRPWQRLIWWAGLISVFIRCSGCFHRRWHSVATDVVELTCCLLHGECQRCVWASCGFHALYGHETRRGLRGRFRFW